MKKSEKIAGISFLLVAVFYIGMYALGGVSEINITDASFVKKYRSYCSICIAGCGFSCQPSLRRGCGNGSCSGAYGNIGRSGYLHICAG